MENEEKYTDIRDKLRSLEQIKAGDNFVHNLHHKIVEMESEKRHEHAIKFDEGRRGFLKNLFANRQFPWLIPAAGFTVLIFFVFYITFMNKNLSDKNEGLFSSDKQETGQQNQPLTKQEETKPVSPSVTSETEKPLTDQGKVTDKDLSGNFRSDDKSDPIEEKRKIETSDIPKLYKDDDAGTDVEKSVENNGMVGEESQSSSEGEITTGITGDEKTDPSPKVSEPEDNVSRGILKKELKKPSRLKEKIDSLSKIDLEKIRKEILR